MNVGAQGVQDAQKGSDIKGRENATRRKRRYSYLLMVAHMCDDINQGALVATIPFLVLYSGYSYAATAALLFASNAASAVIQPLFGWLGDKTSRPWFMALGIFLAGLGMTGIGLFSDYAFIMVSAVVSGIGVAMFHPEGGRLANLVAGEKKGSGMSIFAVGGKLGFTVGPLIAAAALSAWGMAGTVVFIIPATICAVVLLVFNRTFLSFGVSDAAHKSELGIKDDWRAFGIVMGAISTRSIVYYALISFVPLFLVANLGQSESFSSSVISLFAIVGAFATLISGWVGQRTGAKALMILSYAITAGVIALFAFNQSLLVALALVMVMAVFVDLSYPSAVALGQSFVPNHLGMASGISFGVMVCIGGVMSPVLGLVGDAVGLQPVMLLLVVIALIGAGIALCIPSRKGIQS